MSTWEAMRFLYNDGGRGLGGIARFYRGLFPALLQGPLSRFGDTAANAGVMTLVDSMSSTRDLPVVLKTAVASLAAASFRISIMPIDTMKTTLQVSRKERWRPQIGEGERRRRMDDENSNAALVQTHPPHSELRSGNVCRSKEARGCEFYHRKWLATGQPSYGMVLLALQVRLL